MGGESERPAGPILRSTNGCHEAEAGVRECGQGVGTSLVGSRVVEHREIEGVGFEQVKESPRQSAALVWRLDPPLFVAEPRPLWGAGVRGGGAWLAVDQNHSTDRY